MSVLWLGLLLVQTPPARPREERVLSLLQEAVASGCFRYCSAAFHEVEPRMGVGPVIDDELFETCENTDSGTFDDVLVRHVAAECLRAYGLDVATDVDVGSGQERARIDGLDRTARIGFELVGRGCRGTFCNPEDEPPEFALDPAEAAALAREGYRLHVADVRQYRSAGDDFTPTLAYVAGLVRFLDRVTEGEDVVLDGLLFEREREWRFPIPTQPGMGVLDNPTKALWVLEPTTLVVPCGGAEAIRAPVLRRGFWFARLEETDTRSGEMARGAPSVLLLGNALAGLSPGDPRPEIRVRVRQTLDGVEHVREGDSLALFLPGEFDLQSPFSLELKLSPGRYWIHALIGGAASR